MFTQTPMVALVSEVTPQRAGTLLKQITNAVSARKAAEIAEAELLKKPVSKDLDTLDKLVNVETARFFAAVGMNPETYINGKLLSHAEYEKKSKLDAATRTFNLKGYKKVAESVGYLTQGTRLETVLQFFTASAIIASRFHLEIPRDVCKRFLDSVPINHVSESFAEELDKHRAKHMSGGADTQTSQCTLQLSQMRAATVIQNGRFKDFMLDLESPVLESFAIRLGMTSELEKARSKRGELLEKLSG